MHNKDLFSLNSVGRTTLFYAAEREDIVEVRRIIFSLSGTSLSCHRLSVIEVKDSYGLTASDVAEQADHKEISDLLRGEEMRMEFFE